MPTSDRDREGKPAPIAPGSIDPDQANKKEIPQRRSEQNQDSHLSPDAGFRQQRVKALHAFRRAVKINPNKADYHLTMGEAHEELNQYSLATSSYERAYSIMRRRDPTLTYPIYKIGMLYIRLQRYSDARAVVDRLKKLNPSRAKDLGSYLEREMGISDRMKKE